MCMKKVLRAGASFLAYIGSIFAEGYEAVKEGVKDSFAPKTVRHETAHELVPSRSWLSPYLMYNRKPSVRRRRQKQCRS